MRVVITTAEALMASVGRGLSRIASKEFWLAILIGINILFFIFQIVGYPASFIKDFLDLNTNISEIKDSIAQIEENTNSEVEDWPGIIVARYGEVARTAGTIEAKVNNIEQALVSPQIVFHLATVPNPETDCLGAAEEALRSEIDGEIISERDIRKTWKRGSLGLYSQVVVSCKGGILMIAGTGVNRDTSIEAVSDVKNHLVAEWEQLANETQQSGQADE